MTTFAKFYSINIVLNDFPPLLTDKRGLVREERGPLQRSVCLNLFYITSNFVVFLDFLINSREFLIRAHLDRFLLIGTLTPAQQEISHALLTTLFVYLA
jgi:hypothetical protein